MTQIEIAKVPANRDEFLALQGRLASTPEGGAAVLVAALLSYVGGDAQAEAYVAAALDPAGLQSGALRVADRQRLQRQLKGREGIIHSYVEGATTANGYQLPDPPYRLAFSRNPYSGEEASGRVKVFVACSGAATPRPLTLKRGADGLWRAAEWSSLLMGVAGT
jgi:hypothetical protein